MLFHRVLDEEDALVHAFERPQREPSWLEAPRSRRVASFAAAGTFLLTFAVVVLTGCLTLVVSPLSDSRFENLDTQPDDAVRCLRLARRAASTLMAWVLSASRAQAIRLEAGLM